MVPAIVDFRHPKTLSLFEMRFGDNLELIYIHAGRQLEIGEGNRMMEILGELAEKHGLDVVLTIPSGYGDDTKRLYDFFHHHGFELTLDEACQTGLTLQRSR